MNRFRIACGVLVLLAFLFSVTLAQAEKPAAATTKSQTKCPVMGGKIVKSLYYDYNGKRIYFCCKGCIDTLKKDPEKYIKQMESEGITLDKASAEPKKAEEKGKAGACCPGEATKSKGTCTLPAKGDVKNATK